VHCQSLWQRLSEKKEKKTIGSNKEGAGVDETITKCRKAYVHSNLNGWWKLCLTFRALARSAFQRANSHFNIGGRGKSGQEKNCGCVESEVP
jgi:hypothetical protein